MPAIFGQWVRATIAFFILVVYLRLGKNLVDITSNQISCALELYHPYMLVQNNATVPEPEKRYDNRFCGGGDHGLYSLIATIILGGSLITYRILRVFRTRLVKYVHLFFHTVAAFFMLDGVRLIYIHEVGVSHGHSNEHQISSYMVLSIYLFQLTCGFGVMAYTYPNCKLRQQYSLPHGMFGAWLYLCFVGCVCSGMKHGEMVYTMEQVYEFYVGAFPCFILVPIVLFNPLFEWELNGPI